MVKFSGHDKFECKIDWITKGLQAYSCNNTIFSTSNLELSIEQLGLGINMIKSLHHWMKVLGLIENNNLSLLAQKILENDIYLESSDTLWLMHWNLVKSIKRSSLAYLFFNKFYLYKFTKDDIIREVNLWLHEQGIKVSPVTISSDVDVFIKLYKNNEKDMNLFSDLNILNSISASGYTLNINATKDISDKVFLYILLDFIELRYQNVVTSISIDEIEKGILSIQKCLCLSENKLYTKIYKLKELTNNKMYYMESSGMRQIYINELLDKSELLNQIFN